MGAHSRAWPVWRQPTLAGDRLVGDTPPPVTTPAIEVRDLRHRYGSAEVVRGISFSIPPGQICGYLGPNGAGKSTTLKALTGLLSPTGGAALIHGHDVRSDTLAAQRCFGFVPDGGGLYSLLTGREHLALVAELHGVPAGLAAERTAALLHRFDAAGFVDRRVDTLSKGQRQKVALLTALLHQPKVLFLDEPLNGLDVTAARALKDLLVEHARGGGTVLFSSHILDVVERICDRAIILHRGEVVADAATSELVARSKDRTLESIFHQLVTSDRVEGLEGFS